MGLRELHRAAVRRHGAGGSDPYLNFTSGYSGFGSDGRCSQTDTPASCLAHNNGAKGPTTVGYFYYDNGHMQVHAVDMTGLGPDLTSALTTAVVTPMFNLSCSLGHWVEDDPVVGDGAFSSAGLGGFYPWIDKSKASYGVIARNVNIDGTFQGYVSAQCGRMIRQAFVTGVATTATVPTPRH